MQKKGLFEIIQNDSRFSLNPGFCDSDLRPQLSIMQRSLTMKKERRSICMRSRLLIEQLRVETTSPAPSRYRLPSFRIFTDVERKLKLSSIWQLFHGIYISARRARQQGQPRYNLCVFVRARLWQSLMLFFVYACVKYAIKLRHWKVWGKQISVWGKVNNEVTTVF